MENLGLLPQRRCGQQAALPSLAQHRERLEDATDYLEAGGEPVSHSIC